MVTPKEQKEKRKISRQETGKLFYDLCKATFTVTVLGNLAPLFGIGNANFFRSCLVPAAGNNNDSSIFLYWSKNSNTIKL